MMDSTVAESSSDPPVKPSNKEDPDSVANTDPPANVANAEPQISVANSQPPVNATNVARDADVGASREAAEVESSGMSNLQHPLTENAKPPVIATDSPKDAGVSTEATKVELHGMSNLQHQPAKNVKPLASVITVAPAHRADDIVPCAPGSAKVGNSVQESSPSRFSASGLSSWAKNLNFPEPDSKTGSAGNSTFARFASGIGLRLPTNSETASTNNQGASLESFTKGLVDSSRSAVKAVQVKARHLVSQNKRRYQEGGFDLDMTYITENIIAMGFPAGDLSSGLFGYFEGFYRNHMEEVIKFFETHHKGKYKVYNLCSERLYDASRFGGKVACFPFNDHNCPPIQLIPSFCQSAYTWLKEDIQNVVVVHCKAGIARTGLMICSLLLHLKFFPTAEEAMAYYNDKRCVDGKALTLPSQIRYVKYYDHILTRFHGEIPPGRRCMLRGFRILNCPYWIRPMIVISDHSGVLFSTKSHPKTKNLGPEDFWIKAPRKGTVVFALPGEPGLTKLAGDFKVLFQDYHGDFYCWLNTSMTQNKIILSTSDLDGYEKRKLPSPGLQVEILLVDYNDPTPATTSQPESSIQNSESNSSHMKSGATTNTKQSKVTSTEENDDVFSDSDGEESETPTTRQTQVNATEQTRSFTRGMGNLSLKEKEQKQDNILNRSSFGTNQPPSRTEMPDIESIGANNIKSIAADASVFSFGDEDDYESE